jgi:DUF4097 and DUF4098 domain-containing protein YvlB
MYYPKIAIAVSACALVGTVLDASHRNWKAEAREAIHHTFSGDQSLDVDNVDGIIQVMGDNGNSIRVDVEKIIHAASQGELDRAKREVKLDINEKDGVAQLYVNGPFRGNNRSSDDHGFHIHFDDHEYEVTFNFTIHVPHDTGLRLRTVNGDIRAEQTNGKFDVHGVNGGITMTAIAGSGSIRTVNGPTAVTFRQNPNAATDFQSVNGSIDAAFPPGLSADFRFKTLNGQAYTDFESTVLAQNVAHDQRRGGRLVYGANHFSGVRVGAGGPELKFETVNGDIRIKKEAR